MKSVCLYSSYFSGDTIPYYVRFYLEKLTPHFSKIVYLQNRKVLSEESMLFLEKNNIESVMVENEGFDFGMWYKGLKAIQAADFERIALINDSCVLFKDLNSDFKKINEANADYCGMVISDRYATHLQSFFLVINQRAIPVLVNYFQKHGIVNDYREVIQVYEIGLTQEMIASGMKVFSLYNNEARSFPKNPSFALVRNLIDEGMPLIKKKIMFRNFRGLEYYWVVRMNFDTDYRKYVKQVREKYGNEIIDFDRVMKDSPNKSHLDILLFAVARMIANFLRAIPGARWVFHRLVDIYKKYIRKS
jgi:lipopolysaccharide biosynthesis protein